MMNTLLLPVGTVHRFSFMLRNQEPPEIMGSLESMDPTVRTLSKISIILSEFSMQILLSSVLSLSATILS